MQDSNRDFILDRETLHQHRLLRSSKMIRALSIFFILSSVSLVYFLGEKDLNNFVFWSQFFVAIFSGVTYFLAIKKKINLASHIMAWLSFWIITSCIYALEGLNDGRPNVGHLYFLTIGVGLSLVMVEVKQWIKHFYLWLSVSLFLFVQLAPWHVPARTPLNSEGFKIGYMLVSIVASIGLALLVSHFVRQSTMLENTLRSTNDAVYALVNNLLPKEVALDLLQFGEHRCRRYTSTTIMMLDIVKYTALTDRKTLEDLGGTLRPFFESVDGLILNSGAEKIKSIGDAYLVAFGVPRPEGKHAEKMVMLAEKILGTAGEFSDIQVRIGIASGPVLGGVLGKSKMTFDIWGGTVNLVARLESHAEPMSIQISESTYAYLDESFKQKFNFVEKNFLSNKEKKNIRCYVLSSAKKLKLAI